MFPLLVFAGAAFTSTVVIKPLALAFLGTKTFSSGRRVRQLEEQQDVDINPKFELELASRMAKLRKEKLTEQEIAVIKDGMADDMSEITVTKAMLPRKHHDLAGTYFVTPRDEVMLWFFVLNEQGREGEGEIGEFVTMLAKKSKVPRAKIVSTLFGSTKANTYVRPLVETLRSMSRRRYTNRKLAGALAEAKKQNKKKRR